MSDLVEKIENHLVQIFEVAHKLPGWGVRRFEVYKNFEAISGITINNQLDLLKLSDEKIDYFIEKRINKYRLWVSSIGVASGIPGGAIGVLGAIGDIEEYMRNMYNLTQEIMYIYGILPKPFQEQANIQAEYEESFLEFINQETLRGIAIGFGMSSVATLGKNVILAIGKKEAKDILQKSVKDKLITKLSKEIAKKLGQKMTKQMISNAIVKAVPIVGGLFTGGMNYISFYKAGIRIKNGLKEERNIIKQIYLRG